MHTLAHTDTSHVLAHAPTHNRIHRYTSKPPLTHVYAHLTHRLLPSLPPSLTHSLTLSRTPSQFLRSVAEETRIMAAEADLRRTIVNYASHKYVRLSLTHTCPLPPSLPPSLPLSPSPSVSLPLSPSTSLREQACARSLCYVPFSCLAARRTGTHAVCLWVLVCATYMHMHAKIPPVSRFWGLV